MLAPGESSGASPARMDRKTIQRQLDYMVANKDLQLCTVKMPYGAPVRIMMLPGMTPQDSAVNEIIETVQSGVYKRKSAPSPAQKLVRGAFFRFLLLKCDCIAV